MKMNHTNILRTTLKSGLLTAALMVGTLFGSASAEAKATVQHQAPQAATHTLKHVASQASSSGSKSSAQHSSTQAIHDKKGRNKGKQQDAKNDGKHGKNRHLVAKHSPLPHFNCVQYVQQTTNIGLHGNAWEWWDNAEGVMGRGEAPKPGAVMVFSKTGILPYGHVAVVRQVQNSRSVLIDHANWSPIRGHRGQVERSVRAIDVSAENDWSQVRVWYSPTQDIGQTVYPLNGFIYPHKDREIQHHLR